MQKAALTRAAAREANEVCKPWGLSIWGGSVWTINVCH